MRANTPRLEGRLRLAGVLVILGLLAEAVTVSIVHPIAFMAFFGIGGTCIGAGIVIYLLALVRS